MNTLPQRVGLSEIAGLVPTKGPGRGRRRCEHHSIAGGRA